MGAIMIKINETKLKNVGQLRECLANSTAIRIQSAAEGSRRYMHILAVSGGPDYSGLKRGDMRVAVRYFSDSAGYSRRQLTQPVRRYVVEGKLAMAKALLAKVSSLPS